MSMPVKGLQGSNCRYQIEVVKPDQTTWSIAAEAQFQRAAWAAYDKVRAATDQGKFLACRIFEILELKVPALEERRLVEIPDGMKQ